MHRVCTEGPNLTPPGSKKGSILTLFETLCNMLNRRENINFDQKKDPCLQKFEKMCKFCQNFWQFLTIFAKFFLKKIKKLKFFLKNYFFSAQPTGRFAVYISKFSVDTHIYTSWKIVKKNPKNLSNLDIFDTQYVHLCLSLENMFFLFKFWQILDIFDTLYTECIQTLFLKNFYHIFLIFIFHKILFLPDLTMKIWKYTHIYSYILCYIF